MNKRIKKKKEKKRYEKAISEQYPNITNREINKLVHAIYIIKKSIDDARNHLFNSKK